MHPLSLTHTLLSRRPSTSQPRRRCIVLSSLFLLLTASAQPHLLAAAANRPLLPLSPPHCIRASSLLSPILTACEPLDQAA